AAHSSAAAVAASRAAASVTLAIRERRGSRRSGANDAPASSQAALIRTIIAVSTAAFRLASTAARSARCALANTAAIATHAFGLATPSTTPPGSEGAAEAVCADNGGVVAMWYASQTMYAADSASSAGRSPGTASSTAVM